MKNFQVNPPNIPGINRSLLLYFYSRKKSSSLESIISSFHNWAVFSELLTKVKKEKKKSQNIKIGNNN